MERALWFDALFTCKVMRSATRETKLETLKIFLLPVRKLPVKPQFYYPVYATKFTLLPLYSVRCFLELHMFDLYEILNSLLPKCVSWMFSIHLACIHLASYFLIITEV